MIAVVCPVYNAAPFLDWSLAAQLDLAGVGTWIYIDDGSTDGSLDRLQAWSRDRPSVRILALEANGGRAAARNRGLAEVGDAETVCFFDADVAPPPDAAVRLHRAAWSPGAVASVASIRHLDPPDDPYGAYLRLAERGLGPRTHGAVVPWRYLVTAACAVRQGALDRAGGFDETIDYGEDLALAAALAGQAPGGLRAAGTEVPMRGTSTLEEALANIASFGDGVRRSGCRRADLLAVAGLGRVANPTHPLVRLGRSTLVARGVRGLLPVLPPRGQALGVRYLLAHAMLQSLHASPSVLLDS